MKLVNALFKEDPLQKQLRKSNITTDTLTHPVIAKTLKMFKDISKENNEEAMLKMLIKQLEDKGSYSKKIKIMMVLIEISKISKYDICDIILNKKIKVFTKASKFKHNEIEPKGDQLENYICEELLIPLYNYLMKLSTNEQLYHTCKQGDIPFDDIFRRGTKIRFIWIFKLYNIINVILPIIQSTVRLLSLNPQLQFFNQLITFLFNDLAIVNNFVIKALEEASTDNYMLMPYFDMLQFHESLNQQAAVGENINKLYESVKKLGISTTEPSRLNLTKEEMHEIEIQALRVKLISNSLKNPKKDHSVLQTEYNQKIQKKRQFNHLTEPCMVTFSKTQSFNQKWKNLD